MIWFEKFETRLIKTSAYCGDRSTDPAIKISIFVPSRMERRQWFVGSAMDRDRVARSSRSLAKWKVENAPSKRNTSRIYCESCIHYNGPGAENGPAAIRWVLVGLGSTRGLDDSVAHGGTQCLCAYVTQGIVRSCLRSKLCLDTGIVVNYGMNKPLTSISTPAKCFVSLATTARNDAYCCKLMHRGDSIAIYIRCEIGILDNFFFFS